MTSTIPALRAAGLAAVVAFSLTGIAGCGKFAGSDAAKTAAGSTPASQSPLLISPEDLIAARSNALSSGPSISGSVQPERRADLRAEVAAIVLEVLKENGDTVRRGDLLVRLDDTAIRESLTAAEASARAGVQAYEQAERQFQRMAKLRETGVVSVQQLEDVEVRRNSAQSESEAAKTRVASARQQLQRTQVRAPFDGVVSDRKVSGGDTAQVGKELVKVIDPHSLRFEGLVSADRIGEVKAGQRVLFRVNGFAGREFSGTVARVNPAASDATRQVEVLVKFEDAKEQPRVSGLYAEGRIETRRTAALTIASTALVREGDSTFAWRVKNQVLQKVSLTVGERDPASGEVALLSGLEEGDRVLRYPTSTLRDGRPVALSK